MQRFRVHEGTLEPVSGSSYYEPAAWRDPRGPQMSFGQWCVARNAQRDAEYQQWRKRARNG